MTYPPDMQRFGRLNNKGGISRGLTGLWRFGKAQTFNEVTGFKCEAAGLPVQSGRFFRNSTDWMALAGSASDYPGNVTCTVAAWYKVGTGTNTILFGTSAASTNAGYEIIAGISGVAGRNTWRINGSTGVHTPDFTATHQEVATVLTIVPGTGSAAWFNGYRLGTTATTPSGANTQALAINRRGGTTQSSTALMRMVAYWNRQLSPSEIIQLSISPQSLFVRRRVAYSIPSGSVFKPWFAPTTSVVYGYGAA